MNTRQTIKHLITNGLGYCCLYAFFSRFKRTAMIARRLGVSPRAVRYVKQSFKEGNHKCEGCTNCLNKRSEK